MRRPWLDPALAGLIRALRRRDGGMLVLIEGDSTPWASATFAGGRHRLAVRCEGPDGTARATALAAGIEEAEFAIPGHLVAGIGEVEVAGDEVRLEALTVVDD